MRKTCVPFACLALHVALGAALSIPPHAAAQAPQGRAEAVASAPLTLDAALESALRLNPQLRASRFDLEATEGDVRQASAIPNPTLGVDQEDVGRQSRTTTVQISQTLELGGKRSARVELARRGQEIATAEMANRRADVRAGTILAFFSALVAQERVKVAQESQQIAASGLSAAARRVAAGKVSPTEETRARVAEANARIELRKAEAHRATTFRELATSMGVPQAEVTALDGRPESLPLLPSGDQLALRLAASPALRKAQLEVQRAQAAYELERARAVPDVTFSVGTMRSQAANSQTVLGISVPLPLFDRNQGAQLAALRKRDAAQANAEAEALKLRSEALQAADELQLRTGEVQALQQDVLPGARSAYEAASRGFELGKFGFIDVLDAQRTWLEARAQYLEALAQAHRAAAELERRLGTPNDGPDAAVNR